MKDNKLFVVTRDYVKGETFVEDYKILEEDNGTGTILIQNNADKKAIIKVDRVGKVVAYDSGLIGHSVPSSKLSIAKIQATKEEIEELKKELEALPKDDRFYREYVYTLMGRTLFGEDYTVYYLEEPQTNSIEGSLEFVGTLREMARYKDTKMVNIPKRDNHSIKMLTNNYSKENGNIKELKQLMNKELLDRLLKKRDNLDIEIKILEREGDN